MRALVDLDADDALAQLDRAAASPEIVATTDGARLADPTLLRRLRATAGLRVRVTVEALARTDRIAARLRGLARAQDLPLDVVLPIAEGLAPVAGRLFGLAHAVPKIARFLLEPVPDRPLLPRDPAEIQAEIHEAIVAGREAQIPTLLDDQTRVDTELVALRAGLKPAIRLSTTADEAAFVARYRALELAVCAADGTFIDDEGQHARKLRLLYVAPTLAAAEAVAAIEAVTFAPCTDVAARAAQYRALGVALGYPTCCVTAYAQRVILDPAADGAYVAEAFACARDAHTEHPRWELDHLLLETGDAVVPFAPCSYECPAAIALAQAIFAEAARRAPLAARRIQRRLAVPLAVDRRGARAVLDLEGPTIRAAHPRRSSLGGFVHAADTALAERLVGRSWTALDDDVVVLRFDR
ncbi:MAG: hypothetical protein IPJ34_18085 [Myxococcales bacterium]|nr:hypothetical protein [Myxococcales bacterium]